MNTKRDCWLCGKGTGLDNGEMGPGELKPNLFGDLECIYCTAMIQNMVVVMEHPEIIPLTKVITPFGIMLHKKGNHMRGTLSAAEMGIEL